MAKRTNRHVEVRSDGTAWQKAPCGRPIVVSEEDATILLNHSWSIDANGYVVSFSHRDGTRKPVFLKLHRVIAKAAQGQIVDHINGNKGDCRRCNLRVVTKSQNAANIRKVRSSSGFKGVRSSKLTQNHPNPFQAAIVVGGSIKYLGSYPTARAAAVAYDAAALVHFGEHAATNQSLGLL